MGPNYSISTACATSNFCILNAANHIRRGEAVSRSLPSLSWYLIETGMVVITFLLNLAGPDALWWF